MNNPYSIRLIEKKENEIIALVVINWQAEIFKGHFPNHPVFPGALYIQLSCELIEQIYLNQVDSIENLKFLLPLNANYQSFLCSLRNNDQKVEILCETSDNQHKIFKGTFKLVTL